MRSGDFRARVCAANVSPMNSRTENGADVGRVLLALGLLALLALLDDSRPAQTVAATPNAAVAPPHSGH
jgi:hypothetical protein